jgi:hypothetical protein
MGGTGSGRWFRYEARKTTVEECRRIESAMFKREGIIVAGERREGRVVWNEGGPHELVVQFKADARERPHVRLSYRPRAGGVEVEYPVALQTTPVPGGKVRWWFVCPVSVDGRACRRRVGVLYLPPGREYFGCRHCYNLTYQSCRDSHKDDALFRQLGASAGVDPALVRAVLQMARWSNDEESNPVKRRRRNGRRRGSGT